MSALPRQIMNRTDHVLQARTVYVLPTAGRPHLDGAAGGAQDFPDTSPGRRSVVKRFLRVLVLLALPLAVAGCSGGSDSLEEVLVKGVWRVDRYYTELPSGAIGDATSLFNGYRYTFFADGFVLSQGRTGRVRGNWGVDGSGGRDRFGIAIEGTPMFFGRGFVWEVDAYDAESLALVVEDPHVSVTRLVLVRF
jgi:hypothetical protein